MRSRKSRPPGGPPPAKTRGAGREAAAGTYSSRSRSTNASASRLAVLVPPRPPARAGTGRVGSTNCAPVAERDRRPPPGRLRATPSARRASSPRRDWRRRAGEPVSTTISVGRERARADLRLEHVAAPAPPRARCGMPWFEPGPTSRSSTGAASSSSSAVAAAAKRTGRRMIVRASRGQKPRSSSQATLDDPPRHEPDAVERSAEVEEQDRAAASARRRRRRSGSAGRRSRSRA